MGNKQTALQFFLTGLVDLEIGKNVPTDKVRQLHDLFNQAKQMEKQQSIDFARYCLDKANRTFDLDILTSFIDVHQYYNEEYGK